MKKLLLFIPAVLMLSACDTAKKERLVADTLQISLDPPTAFSVAAGGTTAVKALCRSGKSDDADVAPTWSVENNLGTFTPATGKSVVFKAGTTAGSGKIYASAGDVRSAGVTVTVSASGTGGGGGGGGGAGGRPSNMSF